MKIIDASQNDIVNDITETYTTVTEHIGQEDCARLVGKAFAQATGSDLALVSLGKWIPGHISTQNTHGVSGSLYPGEITEQQLCAITPTGWKDTIKTVTLTRRTDKRAGSAGLRPIRRRENLSLYTGDEERLQSGAGQDLQDCDMRSDRRRRSRRKYSGQRNRGA